jgi:hypothetical protein
MYKFVKTLTPWWDSNPGIFCSVGGRDNHFATPPGRLGEFSPTGGSVTFGSLLKITEIAHIFGDFFPRLRLCIHFDKKWVGLHSG